MQPKRRVLPLLAALLAVIAAAVPPVAAQPPASPVSYTEAVSRTIHRSIRLPGTVESRVTSVVAAEVGALVVAMEVEEGDAVTRDQPLVRLRTISYDLQLRAAEGQLKESEARLELADSKLRRARELFDDEVISQDQMDDAFSEFTAWQGRVDQYTAQIDSLKVALNRCVVRAPFAGVVTRKLTDVGQWMDTGGPVVEMIALDQLDVRVEVPERYYDELDRGVTAGLTFEALPGFSAEGKLQRVIPRADPQARSFPIKVRVSNRDRRIAVGMLAEVSLPIGATYDAVLVPKDAVVRQGNQEMVYRIKDDQTVEPVPVTGGQGLGEWIEVQGPLVAGARVVTRGNERLFPGIPVQGQPLEYSLP